MPASRTASRLLLVLVLTVAFVAAVASSAFAAPSDTMGLTDLDTKLSGGTVTGYMKTVLRGSTIETIPVDILAITSGNQGGPESLSALILFEAYGPKIDKIGGIAAGMSGSPIYVNDGGTDKIIGAVSYGDMFTLNGTGLATPIEAMTAIQDDYAVPSQLSLDEPVTTDAGTNDRVIISQSSAGLADDNANGAFVAEPLSAFYLGGIRAKSRVFQDYTTYMKKHGYDVIQPVAGGFGGESSYSAPLESGSAIAALASRGDLWAGGVGTVTYKDAGSVLAFGHPMYWGGETSLYMANAWVDGIWPSSYFPYKMARPAALQGAITQDRMAGIMGREGVELEETAVTAKATNINTSLMKESAVYLPREVANSNSWDFEGLPAIASYVAGSRLFDQWDVPGSAMVTTTVEVKDGNGDLYWVERSNMVDSEYDVTYAVIEDVYSITEALRSLNSQDVDDPAYVADIVSVNVESEIAKARRSAYIVDVQAPKGGLKTGDNTVTVYLRAHGLVPTQTVDVNVTIPEGTPVTGALTVTAGDSYWVSDSYGDEEFFEFMYWDGGYSAPQTVADAVDDMNDELANNQLTVTFAPVEPESMIEGGSMSIMPRIYDEIEVDAPTEWVVEGYAEKMSLAIEQLDLWPTTIAYKGTTWMSGVLSGSEDPRPYKIFAQYANETSEQVVASGTADFDEEFGVMYFEKAVKYLTKNATLRVVFAGDDQYLSTEATAAVNVGAKISVSSSKTSFYRGTTITLTGAVLPADAAGTVVFERYYGGKYVAITTPKTIVDGKATCTWKPPAGTQKVRARYVPAVGAANTKSTSSVINIYVR